jgi:hypothetical protein
VIFTDIDLHAVAQEMVCRADIRGWLLKRRQDRGRLSGFPVGK